MDLRANFKKGEQSEGTMRDTAALPVCAGLLLVIGLGFPQALAAAPSAHPLQAAQTSSPGQCFGYNGVNDSDIPRIISSLRIALIQPILTATPYSQYDFGSFYAFYAKEAGVTADVTTNLDLLSTNVSSGYGFNNGWGLSLGTYEFFTSQMAVNCGLVIGKNVQVLTDMDVADGALFTPQNHTARFDVVVLPFSEYVEAQEYLAYEDFVGEGGTIVMMGHSLEYPVAYNASTGIETLVYGHNWANNGTYASPIACGSNTYVVSCPWAKNNTDWIGSNTCEASCFHTYTLNGSVVNPTNPIGKALYKEFGSVVMKSYVEHEEDTVMNMTDTQIVSVFVNDSRNLIAPYTHQFRKGTVVCFDIFGDDIIGTDPSAQYFLLQGIVLGRSVPNSTVVESSATLTPPATTSSSSPTSASAQPANSSSTASMAALPGSPPWALLGVGVAVVAVVAAVLVVRRRA
jgi:hypothetical protein